MKAIQDSLYRWLRWSERYIKTDMVYFAHGGFWLFLAKVMAVLFGFVLSIAFANLLEPEKYGVYKYILSVVSITSTFSLIGMGTAVNRAAARGFEGALREGFFATLRWSIPSVLIAGLVALYYLVQGNQVLAVGIAFGGIMSPIIAAASLYDNFLGGLQQFFAKTWYNTLRSIVPIVVLVPALYVTNNPAVFTVLYFVATTAIALFCYYRVLAIYNPHDRTDGTQTLSFSKHLSAINIISIIISQLDRVLIFSQLGGTSLALYSFAEAGPDQLRGLTNIIGSLAFPKMSRRSFSEIRNVITGKAVLLFLAGTLLAGAYICIAPYLFTWFFPRYVGAIAYSQVYALIIPIVMPSILYSQALITHMKKRELYINNIIASIWRIGLLVVLVMLYGIWGIVIGTVIYYATSALLLLVLFYRATDDALQEEIESVDSV